MLSAEAARLIVQAVERLNSDAPTPPTELLEGPVDPYLEWVIEQALAWYDEGGGASKMAAVLLFLRLASLHEDMSDVDNFAERLMDRARKGRRSLRSGMRRVNPNRWFRLRPHRHAASDQELKLRSPSYLLQAVRADFDESPEEKAASLTHGEYLDWAIASALAWLEEGRPLDAAGLYCVLLLSHDEFKRKPIPTSFPYELCHIAKTEGPKAFELAMRRHLMR